MKEISPELLLKLSQHPEPAIRAEGRLMATKFSEEFEKWFEAEIERGSDPGPVIVAFISVTAKMAGFLYAQSDGPSHARTDIPERVGKAFGSVVREWLKGGAK